MKHNRIISRVLLLVSLALVFLWMPEAATAAVKTWTGNGDWHADTGNWSPSVPADGDEAVIDGNVNLTNSTPILAAYTLNAARTNTFLGTNTFLYATNVTINGTMTHATNTATNAVGGVWYPDNLLQIIASSNVTIAADGIALTNYYGNDGSQLTGYGCGGGAGGSVYIECGRFAGSGSISANGANGPGANSGGGGGGRIAIWRIPTRDQWTGTGFDTNFVVAGGAGNATSGSNGVPGTVFFGDIPIPSGTVIMFR